MEDKVIYLNHAATSYPKPRCVLKAYTAALEALPAGQFRGEIRGINDGAMDRCRTNLGKILGIADAKRIFFSSGATDAANLILEGLGIQADQIVTTATEHNCVLRPMYNMTSIKGIPQIVPCNQYGYVDPELVEAAITFQTRAIVLNHCSNVTGCIQNAAEIGFIAKKHHLLYVLDVSQSAGVIPVEAENWNTDAVFFTGHKGLFGVQGTGGYYLKETIPCRPVRFGGTGYNSERIYYESGQEEYEVGTQNVPGIAALNAGCEYVIKKGIQNIQKREVKLIQYLYCKLAEIKDIKIHGDASRITGPVLSFHSTKMKASDIAYILQNSYHIVTRAGLHCAPLIHSFIGAPSDGTVRVSISCNTRKEELDALAEALYEITGAFQKAVLTKE